MKKPNSNSTIMELQNVNMFYPTGAEPFHALKDVNLTIQKGEFLGITGKSGAGKTTLLNMISGVSDPTSGTVHFYGNEQMNGKNGLGNIEINQLDEDEKARWRGEHVGIVYQSFELLPNLNLIENINLPIDFLEKYDPEESPASARILLEQVEILEHANKIPAHISGGEKQRVAIARALVNDPPIILADEPTGNLDSVTAENIFKIFEDLVKRGKTIVMVTHDESLVKRFSRRLLIVDGEITEPKSTIANISASLSAGESSRHGNFASQANGESASQNKVQDSRQTRPQNGKSKAKSKTKHLAVVLKNVTKIYESPAGKFVALKSIDLNLDFGQFVSIVGKSGSGKSTLINMITGIDHPTSGKVTVNNLDIYTLTESERALWRGKNMGVVFQFFQLLPSLTLLENTMLPMDYCDIYAYEERPKQAMALLEKVGLAKQANSLPGSVSSGQQQSAAIARALANDPSIILADEPTGNLDSRSAEVILNLFEELALQGKTILIVTHDSSITERTNQTIILSDGEIVDQAIAQTLPFLPHPLMLKATKEAKKTTFLPNEVIINQGEEVNHFYMVVKGSVDVLVKNKNCEELLLANLGQGQFFGEVELMGGDHSIAAVRSSKHEETVIATLPKKAFQEIINKSNRMKSYIRDVASNRKSENITKVDKDC